MNRLFPLLLVLAFGSGWVSGCGGPDEGDTHFSDGDTERSESTEEEPADSDSDSATDTEPMEEETEDREEEREEEREGTDGEMESAETDKEEEITDDRAEEAGEEEDGGLEERAESEEMDTQEPPESEEESGSGDYTASWKGPTVMATGEETRVRTFLASASGLSDLGGYTVSVENETPGVIGFGPYVESTRSLGLTGLAVGNGRATLRFLLGEDVAAEAVFEVEVRARARVEARGIWLKRWDIGDADHLRSVIAQAKEAGFNQVYLQVRGVFDAYYQSQVEPWAASLDGSWDPLEVGIEAAHERGMELHAWINVFTLWSGSSAPTNAAHAYHLHPDWIMCDSEGTPQALPGVDGYVWVSPGNPAVRARNTLVAVDIATNYDVDGLHLDRLRYPGTEYSHDAASLSAYAAALETDPSLSYADWERAQVVAQVAQMYEALAEIRPVVLSAAVVGIYRSDELGWSNVAEGYVDYLQDPRAMDEQEVIDVLIPMAYWPCATTYGARTDFCALTDNWAGHRSRAFVYMGSDLQSSRAYESFASVETQIDKTRSTAGISGWALYDHAALDSAAYADDLAAGPFAEPALLPFMWWK